MQEIVNSVETGSTQVDEMVKTIINNRTSDIDNYIDKVRNLFVSASEIPDGDLDKIILDIPVHIYYLTSVLQDIDIRKGISAETAKYNENEALLQATGTVAEKQARATNSTLKNRIVSIAYKTATATVQGKMNAAMEILSSAKKIQQRRLEEMKLTKLAGNSVGAF